MYIPLSCHVTIYYFMQIGGLHIECSRNIYGRQISSFESKVKLHLPMAHSSTKGEPHPPGHTPLNQDKECHGIFIRAPGIVKLNSPTVQVLGTLRDEENSIVAVQQDNLIATCFHPELTDDPTWHMYFVEQVIAQRYPSKVDK